MNYLKVMSECRSLEIRHITRFIDKSFVPVGKEYKRYILKLSDLIKLRCLKYPIHMDDEIADLMNKKGFQSIRTAEKSKGWIVYIKNKHDKGKLEKWVKESVQLSR